ncbi:orc1/cdc6 family replication initiation protein [Candidatus Pacearchaeota archaeon]|nr:orc1/cdc6 family replication initiation protein [Candidatus Pacearchaeota archaeon]
MASQIDKIFDSFSNSSIFKNKFTLQSNYIPEIIQHREQQIESIASILAPCLRLERTSNLFIYGKTGTGKTVSITYLKDELLKRAKKENISLNIEYINCKLKKVADTEYRILSELIRKLGSTVPATGLPTEVVYNKFIEILEAKPQLFVLILDEVDYAIKKISDNFLYNLIRLNSELSKAQISIIGISNDLTFLDNIDPRVRSSLSEEEIVFPPYNALQLQDILRDRAGHAFKENVVENGVIEKCAAYAAREHGDARRALDLLRIAGELVEREGVKKITQGHIDKANEKIEKDKILDIVETEPKQFQLVLESIIELIELKKLPQIFTGDIYNHYKLLCEKTSNEILTQRRVGDIIAEFDMLGIINAVVISKGRHGRTREIKLAVPQQLVPKIKAILSSSLGVEE